MSSFQPSAPQSGSIFGASSTGTSGAATSNTTQSNMFGAKPAGTGGLFGATSNTSTNTGGLFGGGGASGQTSGGLFGGGSNTTIPSTNIFGGASTNTGAPATTPTANAPTGNSMFGGTPFSLPKPADGATAPKPAGSSFFSQPSTSTATGSAPGTGGLFGLPPKPAEATATSNPGNAPAPSGGLFGNNLFGKPPAAPAASTPTAQPAFSLGGNKDAPPINTTGPPPAPATGIFGNLGGLKPAEKKDGTTPTAPTAAPAASFNLFGAPKADERKDGPTPAPTGGLFGNQPASKDAPKSATASATTPSTALVAVPPPSMLRGKTIEEIVNRWTSELETHVKEFNRFAGEVSVWDRALIENGNNLAALYGHVQAAEREQNEIEQCLDHIEQQQKELDSTLAAYEKVSQEILGNGSLRGLDTGPADTERDKNYMLATDLHTHLDDLSGSLTQMIDSVNALSLPSNDTNAGDDPMAQIAQILSSHLESLQWIDGAVREVDSKVTEVEKRVKDSGHGNTGGNGQKSRGFGLRS